MARTKNRYNALGLKTEPAEEQMTRCQTALYARISSEHGDKPSESIENQLELMRRFVKDKPELGVCKEYVDRAYSGTNFQRPAFQAMMEDIKAGRIHCVIVKDVSRLGRDYLETCNLIETIFRFLDVRFIAVNDHYDTKEACNGNKELEISIKNMVNDMYARDVSKRIATAREQEIVRGRFTGSNAPYGYRIDYDHPLRQLIKDPPAAEVVGDMFQMAADGMSLRDISLELQRRNLNIPGIYAKTGQLYQAEDQEKRQWNIGTISSILANEAYIGNMVQGRYQVRLCDGVKDHRQDREDWVVVENTHEAIIDKAVFQKVRDILQQKREDSTFAVKRTEELPMEKNKYAGLLFCGNCGCAMTFSSEIRGGRRRYFFLCSNTYRLDKDRCKTRITEKELDKIVASSITAIYQSMCKKNKASDIKVLYRQTLEQEEKKYLQRRKKMCQQIETLRHQQTESYEAYATGRMPREEFVGRKESLEEACMSINKDIGILDDSFQKLKAEVKRRSRWITFLSDGQKEENLSAGLLQILVKRIEAFEDHRIHIVYAFEEPGGEA